MTCSCSYPNIIHNFDCYRDKNMENISAAVIYLNTIERKSRLNIDFFIVRGEKYATVAKGSRV